MRRRRHAFGSVLGSATLIIAAAVGLGPPKPALAWTFFDGSAITIPAAEAVSELLAWSAVAGVCLITFGFSVRSLRGRHNALGRAEQAALFLVAGSLILGLALVQRAMSSPRMCCGSDAAHIHEVMQLAR